MGNRGWHSCHPNLVWLVGIGGFAVSTWLFSQLPGRLEPLGVTVSRPDNQTSPLFVLAIYRSMLTLITQIQGSVHLFSQQHRDRQTEEKLECVQRHSLSVLHTIRWAGTVMLDKYKPHY